jgi:flagellar motor switch protein FliM
MSEEVESEDSESSRKLTQEEVNALISGLDDQVDQANPGSGSKDADVREFDFGSDDLSLLGDYYALRVINERFARMSRAVFLPMLKVTPRITSFAPKTQTFDEYCDTVDTFMSLTMTRMDELRGSKMLVMSPDFISTLTNSYYGGSMKILGAKRSDFTTTEDRVIEIVTDSLNDILLAAWNDLMPITFGETTREENVAFASFVDGSETVIVCSFVVQVPGVDPANFDIVYPLQTLKPIATQLRSRMQTDVVEDDMSWRDRLQEAVLNATVEMTVQLSKPTVSLHKLLQLNEGDVFPIQIGENVNIIVEDQNMFLADIGDVGGTRAVNITKRLT